MQRFYGKMIVTMLVVMLVGLLATAIYAQEEQPQQENKVARFFKNIVKWPFSITKKGVETVGDTAEKGVDTGAKTTTAAVETVTGKPEKIKDVVVEPVKGSAGTAYTAVDGSVKTPIEGTKEAFE